MERSCEYCDKQFTANKNLFALVRNVHKVEPKLVQKKLCCALCGAFRKTYEDLRDHYVETHGKEIFKETKAFSSLSDQEMQCSYMKETETTRSYYICHRSGSSRQILAANSRKTQRSQGFMKMGSCWPSTLELREECRELFKATLLTPHIGHECSLKYWNLSKGEGVEITGKIQMGISFKRILDYVRSSTSMEQSVERIHLLSRQDLRNIDLRIFIKRRMPIS